MVAKGLPDAEQRILADARQYLEEWAKVKKNNREIIAGNKELETSLTRVENAIKRVEKSVSDVARQYEKMERQKEYIRSFNEMEQAVDAASEANRRFNANPVEIQDHTHLIEEATRAYQDHTGATDFLRQATVRYLEEVGRADDTHQQIIDSTKQMTAATQEAAQARRDLASAHREVETSLQRLTRYERPLGISPGAPSYAAPGQADQGGGMAAFLSGMGRDRLYGGMGGVLGAMMSGAGGHPLASAALGAGALGSMIGWDRVGTGAGNIASAIGGASGGGPTAADTSRVVTGFIRRWYPAAHWALMLTNELLATAGPAAAAGGMGALTGMQGFEQLIPRGKAVFNASEALGDSTGMTTGKFWGLKTAYLQNAQDLANGMATQMAGAMVNIIGSPHTGGAFTQLGLNTDSMVSRFMATLTQDFQKGGLGGQLSNMVTGGTGYLQQFGDVGANLGRTFLNLAPNLPGVGGDLLGLLTGGTGALASTTHWLGGALGPLLAGEAGMRWGPAIVGTAGRGIAGLGNILGNAGRGGILSRIGLGTGTEGGLAGIGAAIGGLSAPEIGGIAAAALLANKMYTYQTPAMVAGNQMVAQLGQQGFVPGLGLGIQDMQQLAATRPGGNLMAGASLGNIGGGLKSIYSGVNAWSPGQVWGGIVRAGHGFLQMGQQIMGGGTAADLTPYEVAQQKINQISQAMVNGLGAGQQIQQVWKGVSGQALDMGKAFDVATMAQLQLGSSFEKNGRLTGQAQTMIKNLYAGYAPMNMNSGMFGAAVGAQTAMSGLQHTQVAAVNQAYDQLSQLVQGGAASSSTFFGLLGGTPTTFRRGGIQFAQAPALSAMSRALGSFTTPTGAAAWNRLVNPQSGLLPALGGQMDWLRQAQTMGALTAGQTTGMASFEMAQLLPALKGDPAALAMLSTYAQQFGGPSFRPGASAGSMFKSLSGFFGRTGVGAGGYNRLMTRGTEAMANIGTDAQQFVQQIGSGIGGALAQGIAAHGANLQDAFMNSVTGGAHPHFGLQALEQYGKFMAGSGVPKQGAIDMARYATQVAGGGPHLQALVSQQLGNLYAKLKIQVDTASARSAIANLAHVAAQPHVTVKALTAAAQAAINAIKGKDVPVNVKAAGIAAIQAAIDAIHGKNVTVTITTINRLITQQIGLQGAPGGVAAATLVGGMAGQRLRSGMQTGGLVPGSGKGDIIPAMLEPGEAIVPGYLVPLIAPILAAHHVPGFGGMPQGKASHFAAGGLVPHMLGFPDPTRVGNFFSLGGGSAGHLGAGGGLGPLMVKAGQQLSFTLIGEISKALTAAGAKKIADALMSKIAQELQYAKSVTQATKQGLNLGGLDTTQQSVPDAMQSYLTSIKSFSKDLGTLSKGHLSKDLMKQLIAAGPVQGDALAQSILQGGGTSGPGAGIKQVNQLWAAIGKASQHLGAQAGQAIFGGTLAPNLRSGTFMTNNVSIHISMNGGGGDLGSMSQKDLNRLVAEIQKKLLQQANRNRGTNLKLKGKNP